MPSNVVQSLLCREIGGSIRGSTQNGHHLGDVNRKLREWVTAEASKHRLSECCTLNNVPRSTIAATVNRDGTLLASTHGDHTVKLVDFQTGQFLMEFNGHRRTPWTVKFHPLHSNLLVSGSLDYEIKLWDIDTGTSRQSKDFGKQISSISFHPSGKALAIAAGHKLFLWEFNEEKGLFEKSSCILHASCMIRTVHFDPIRGDKVMISERADISQVPPPSDALPSSSSRSMDPVPSTNTMTGAAIAAASITNQASRNTFHPYIYLNDLQQQQQQQSQAFQQSSFRSGGTSAGANFNRQPPIALQHLMNLNSRLMNTNARASTPSTPTNTERSPNSGSNIHYPPLGDSSLSPSPLQPPSQSPPIQGTGMLPLGFPTNIGLMSSTTNSPNAAMDLGMGAGAIGLHENGAASDNRTSEAILRQMGRFPQLFVPYPPPPPPQLPSLGLFPSPLWNNAGVHTAGNYPNDMSYRFGDISRTSTPPSQQQQQSPPSPLNLQLNSQLHGSNASSNGGGNPRLLYGNQGHHLPSLSVPTLRANINNNNNNNLTTMTLGGNSLSNPNLELIRTGQISELPTVPTMLWQRIPNAVPTMAPSAARNDRPHVTKLVLYDFDIKKPHSPLSAELFRIDYAVICSEMGAHISPCGRMLVVCVASTYRNQSAVHHQQQPQQGFNYELRVVSLEKPTFGQVLRSRWISAGHCLTSVQFSPGSDMILLSYGRKHASLLRNLEMNGAPIGQIHTVLELYSAKTLALMRVMHSREDEANTASFHPFAGEGIIFGTKNGKLNILRHKRRHNSCSNGEEDNENQHEEEDDGDKIHSYENELLEVSEDDSG